MADFTLSSGSICKPHRSPWGAFPTRAYAVSTGVSSNTIHVGRVVTLDWTGSTTAGRILASSANATFFAVGVAASGASGSTAVTGLPGVATEVSVYEANPMVEFRAATKNGLLASSIVGLRKTLAWDSTLNISYVDIIDSTKSNWRVAITALVDQEGDSGGYVAFRFMSKLTENIGSSIALTSTSPLLAFYA